ncbi:MAG: ATP synthase F1 subunit epsilon [Chitinispirillaceae bacterium]|nr:ATP synthase F1 subunit epsilon [Chitinispirillaceae bacterium]
MKTVPCEILTPEKVMVKEEADFVVAPGLEGELGVLPGHARLFARLASGEVRIVKGPETKKYAINGGFVRIEPAAVKIVTPAIKPV